MPNKSKDQRLDEALAESFPASDPLPMSMGTDVDHQPTKEIPMTNETPAYLIASSIMPEDHGALEPYANAAHPLMEAAGAEILVAGEAGQTFDHYEGQWITNASLSIFKFPSMDALKTFWNSPEYQAIKHLRTDVIAPNFTFAVGGFDMSSWLEGHPEHAE